MYTYRYEYVKHIANISKYQLMSHCCNALIQLIKKNSASNYFMCFRSAEKSLAFLFPFCANVIITIILLMRPHAKYKG